MPGQRQLFGSRKDSQPCERPVIRRFLNENRLRQIHLARNSLHLRCRKPVAVGNNREWISREPFGGKDVNRVKSPLHFSPLRPYGAHYIFNLQAFEFRECPLVPYIASI